MATGPATDPRPEPDPTGIGVRTDERLAGLDGAPVDDHVAVYDSVQRDLAGALTTTATAAVTGS